MPLQIDDVRDLIRLIRENPEWKAELRREVLSDELLSLPDLVRQNSVDIRDLKDLVAENSRDIRRLIEAVDTMNTQMKEHHEHIASLRGWTLEQQYTKTPTRFLSGQGGLVRKLQVKNPRDLECVEEAVDSGVLSGNEADDIFLLDLVVTGREGRGDEAHDTTLAVEISWTIAEKAIVRARRRADGLTKAGCPSVRAVVAGKTMHERDRWLAVRERVEVMLEDPNLDVD